MKVYLVSEVAYYSYGNDPINKKFEMFKTKEDAIKYKEKSAEKWIDILMIYYECETIDDLKAYIDIEEYDDIFWEYTIDNGVEGAEIEVIELDLPSIK